jgi:hypothetical protein
MNVGDRTCAACDCSLDDNVIRVAVGGRPVEVCSSACAEALSEACAARLPERWAVDGQQAALTVRSIETASGRISYAEAGSGPVALFVHGALLTSICGVINSRGFPIFVAASLSICWHIATRRSSRIKMFPPPRTPTC